MSKTPNRKSTGVDGQISAGNDHCLNDLGQNGEKVLDSVEKMTYTQLGHKEPSDVEVLNSIVKCFDRQKLGTEKFKLLEKTAEDDCHQTMTDTENIYVRSIVKQEQIGTQNNFLHLSGLRNKPCIHQLAAAISDDQKGYHWCDWHPGDPIPDGAVEGGFDIDKEKIYVCRAYYIDHLLPGKCVPARGKVYLSHDRKEITLYKCEIMVRTTAILDWVPSEIGHIPKDAIPVGTFVRSQQDEETLFSGRVKITQPYSGIESLCLGRVHKNCGHCYVPFDLYEHCYPKDYEVLVERLSI